LLSYGILPRADFAALRQPSMASLLEYVVGHWGAVFISVGVVVSVLGAYLAWMLMAAEALYIPATMADMPRFNNRSRTRELIIGAVAVVYTLFLVFVAGPKFLLFSCSTMPQQSRRVATRIAPTS
jgi:arginine:ornithine antiporter / lysine permease